MAGSGRRFTREQFLARLSFAGQLSKIAIRTEDFDALLQEATDLVAKGLDVELAKVLEILPGGDQLLVRAGVGWKPGVVGYAVIGAHAASAPGLALATNQGIVSHDLQEETRFAIPELLREHGVRSSANVIIQGDGQPYGVLEVDSREPRSFSDEELQFLQFYANRLGGVIANFRLSELKKTAEERELLLQQKDLLLREIHHRVRNSLQLVSSLLHLQAQAFDDKTVREQFAIAQGRILTVARAHDRLYQLGRVEAVEIGAFLRGLGDDLQKSVMAGAGQSLQVEAVSAEIPAIQAVPLALIVNELVTNALKHAVAGRPDGRVLVSLARDAERNFVLGVADNGPGLPDGFSTGRPGSLGMKLVGAMVAQLQGELTVDRQAPGARFTITFPAKER